VTFIVNLSSHSTTASLSADVWTRGQQTFCKERDGKYFSKYCRLFEPYDLSQVLDSAIGVRAATINNVYEQNGCYWVSIQFYLQKLTVGQIWPAGCRPWSGYCQPFFACMSIVPFTVLLI